MSAPRKISISHLQSRMIDVNGKGGTEVYHHDDVVRELVEALEKVSDNMAKMATGYTSLIDSTKRTADAALAKIAQEEPK